MLLGEAIRQARVRLGRTQGDLAADAGIDHSYIAYIESGTRLCSWELLPRFAEMLGLSIDALQAAWLSSKAEEQNAKLQASVPYLSSEEIESAASRDRSIFLEAAQKDRIDFPRDRRTVARILCAMELVFDEYVLGAEKVGKRDIFAGTFRSYRDVAPAIVVATLSVKTGQPVTEQTKTFQMLHEVGHCRLQWSTEVDQALDLVLPDQPVFCSSGERNSPRERQANAYAAAFLMPASDLRAVLGSRRTVSMDSFMSKYGRELCERFFVEPWMLRYRMKSLGIRVI